MSGENVLSLSTCSQHCWAIKHAGQKQIKHAGSVPLQAWHCSDNGTLVPSKCPAHWPDHDPTYNHYRPPDSALFLPFLQDILTLSQNHCIHFQAILKEEYRQMSQRSDSDSEQGATAKAKSKIDTNISAKDLHYFQLTFFNFKVTKQD